MMKFSKIREDAEMIWRTLDRRGEMPASKLAKTLGLTMGVVLLAIGWLSRENRIEVSEINGETTARLPRLIYF